MYTYPISINYMARVKAALMDKPDHGRKLVTRRAELGLSLADIERETNGVVYDQLLWRIENGKKKPESLKMSQRSALAEVLRWETRQLDDALSLRKPNIFTDEVSLESADINKGRRRIPVIDLLSAGPGGDGGNVVSHVDLGPEYIGPHSAYRVSGDSMVPDIVDRGTVIVRCQEYSSPKNTIVCWTPEDGMLCKYLDRVEDGQYVLTSTNPMYKPIWAREIHIYGIVVEARKPFAVINGNH